MLIVLGLLYMFNKTGTENSGWQREHTDPEASDDRRHHLAGYGHRHDIPVAYRCERRNSPPHSGWDVGKRARVRRSAELKQQRPSVQELLTVPQMVPPWINCATSATAPTFLRGEANTGVPRPGTRCCNPALCSSSVEMLFGTST